MKKLKVLIASMIGAIALVFACVVGTRVNAANVSKTEEQSKPSTGTYVLTSDTVISGSTVKKDSDTNIAGHNYGIFTFGVAAEATPKWAYGTGNSTNYVYARGNNQTISIILDEGQTVDFTIVVTAVDLSKNTNLTITGDSNSLFNSSTSISAKYEEKVITPSYTSSADDTEVVLNFGNKIGFKSITADVHSSDTKSVSFYVDCVKTSVVINEGTVVMPSNPVKEGCTFNGWFNADGTAFVNSGLTDSINVYADFTRDELTGSYTADYHALESSSASSTTNTVIDDHITILAKDGQYEQVTFGSSKKSASDSTSVEKYVKLNGNGSKTFRCMKFIVDKEQDVKLYLYGSSSKDTMYTIINEDDQDIVKQETVAKADSVTAIVKHLSAGTYYLYCDRTDTSAQTALTLYGISYLSTYYTPNVVLSVDANSNNTKVRVTATIDNANIVSEKVSGVESMQYTIEGTTWSKDITSVYSSVDSADSGFYRTKDYTVYAIVVFDGYNKVKADFDITFTVTLAGGQTVSKTITVVKPSA